MKVVSREEWTQARKALLVREKEFSREREALAQARRDLPWEEVTKDYVFDGPLGHPGLLLLTASELAQPVTSNRSTSA